MTETGKPVMLAAEQAKRRRARSIAIACVLGFLVVTFYVITIIKLVPGTAQQGG